MTEFFDFVSAAAVSERDEAMVEAASDCLDRFTECFNACDAIGMDGELHFPHVMLSGASRLDWLQPGQHSADFFTALKNSGWNHTRYESKEPVLVSQDKVHFVVTYSRRNSDGDVISMHKNLWILVRASGRWRICLRSY